MDFTARRDLRITGGRRSAAVSPAPPYAHSILQVGAIDIDTILCGNIAGPLGRQKLERQLLVRPSFNALQIVEGFGCVRLGPSVAGGSAGQMFVASIGGKLRAKL